MQYAVMFLFVFSCFNVLLSLYLLILFLSSLRSDKRSFLMCFFFFFNKKRVDFAKKVVMLQPFRNILYLCGVNIIYIVTV